MVRSRRIGPAMGMRELYFKLESTNPTGSYKDRFAAAAIGDMLAHGRRRCLATSSGNTGAALAAYCAAAGIACHIAVVEGAPAGKLTQMLAYGAKLYRVKGFGPDAAITAATFDFVKHAAEADDAALQISGYCFSPVGMAGVESIAGEIADALGPIDHVVCPAGGGGLTLAVARGFESAAKSGRVPMPRIECVQPAGNDTIATPLFSGANRARAVTCTSAISGLQVPSVVDGDAVIAACRASGGTGHIVTDEQVWAAQRRLAREEGVFSEPAGAVALAGLIEAVAAGRIDPAARAVCLVTGSAFKDPPSLEKLVGGAAPIDLGLDALRRHAAWAR
jgi:threonine synthase